MRTMQTSLRQKPLTLLDVVATVSDLTDDDTEAAEVINHMLVSERIAFANRPRAQDLERLLS